MGIINPAELDLKEEVVVKINRTAKVTSRGKRFRFSALVVVGDGAGHVGVCLGKANEVISSIQKGKEIAKSILWISHYFDKWKKCNFIRAMIAVMNDKSFELLYHHIQ